MTAIVVTAARPSARKVFVISVAAWVKVFAAPVAVVAPTVLLAGVALHRRCCRMEKNLTTSTTTTTVLSISISISIRMINIVPKLEIGQNVYLLG